jgi:Tol biopolymer transport system component
METDDLQFLLATGLGDGHSLGFSPDGRYLVVTGPEDGRQLFYEQRNDIYLYDLTTNQIQTFAGTNPGFALANTYDWSADGQWLVIAQESQTMALVAPAYDYLQLIPHNLGACSNVVWVNQ